MMHDREKSDLAIVATKPTNKARWLLLGSGVVVSSSRNQAGDEGA